MRAFIIACCVAIILAIGAAAMLNSLRAAKLVHGVLHDCRSPR